METNHVAVHLKNLKTYFVGGEAQVLSGLPVTFKSMVLNGAPREVNPNGEHVFGQMYVQEYRLQEPKHELPVLLWHGGGMTGCTWETKPDGGTGWAWRLLEAGYDVIVCDSVERGRSSFGMTPHVYPTEPVFRTKEEGWTTFRLGLKYSTDLSTRHVFEGQRFPIDHFDDFAKQWVPRFPNNETRILNAYERLVLRVGPCVIVGHSQGAGFAAEVACRLPGLVKRVVAVEPGGVPSTPNYKELPPHLLIWGDFIEQSGTHWQRYRAQADAYVALAETVTAMTVVDLPNIGISGNSHFPMMDDNSDQVLSLVFDWLESEPTSQFTPKHQETT